MTAEQQGPDEVGSARGHHGRRLWLGPAVTALAVVVVAATVSYVTDDSSAEQPPPLRLAGGAGAELAADAVMSSPAGPAYVLDGSLPEGTPDPAPVYEFVPGTADESTVNELAQALGLTAAPTRLDGGWLVTDTAGQLHVADDGGQPWSFLSPATGNVECPPELLAAATESSESRLTACAYVSGAPTESTGPDGTVMYRGSYTPLSHEPAPAEDVVRQAATPVFEAVGVDAEAMNVTSTPGMANVERQVAGLPAFGLETGVTVLADGTVLTAYGYLGSTQPGDSYPLISATEAFDQLAAEGGQATMLAEVRPTPMPELSAATAPTPVPTSLPGHTPVEQLANPPMPAPECVAADCRAPASPVAPAVPDPAVPEPTVEPPSDATPPPPPEPQRVTGAELGLMLHWTDEQPVLVPAWLFTIEGDWVLPVVAVEPEFLADPEEPVTGPGGGEPGSPGTPEPLPAEPQPGVYPGVSFSDASVSPDGRTLTVTVTGQPQGDGPCEATYAIDAKADHEQVMVAVTMTPNNQGAEIACTLIAEVIELTVTLDEPLGDRAVLDAATGLEVSVQDR